MTMIGHHIPKDYPKSPAHLLTKKDVPPKEPFSPQQWAATFSKILGKPVAIDKPKEA